MNELFIKKAEEFATYAHEGQTRKYNGMPYIKHPEKIAQRVREYAKLQDHPNHETMIKAAWIHDVIEDCLHKVSKEQVLAATDEATFQLAMELTNPSKGIKASRWIRKQMDRDHLKNVSWEAKIIKKFDRIENIYDSIDVIKNDPREGIRLDAMSFGRVYVGESLLLLEVIKDADPELADELYKAIRKLELLSSGIES